MKRPMLHQTREQPTTRRGIVRRSVHNLSALLLLTALFSLFVAVPTAHAATITADGVTCTLVDAITAANSDTAVGGCAAGNGADTITLNNSVYALIAVNNDANGLPVITSPITIVGNGATLQRLSTAPAFRFFEVASNGHLTLTGLTLTGGQVSGFGQAGAILNFGILQVTDSVIQGNRAFTRGPSITTTERPA